MQNNKPCFNARLILHVVTPGVFGLIVNLTLFLSPIAVMPAHGAQHAKNRRGGATHVPGVIRLVPGKRVRQILSGGGTHDYPLSLYAGQFIQIEVMQQGIDVEATLFSPDGKELFKVDSPNGTEGPEFVLAIAEGSGEHRLRVSSPEGKAIPGRYDVEVKELHAASQRDKDRVGAERVFIEATPFAVQRIEPALRQAIAKYDESLALRRTLNDPAGEARTLYNAAYVYVYLKEYPNALNYFGRALSFYRRGKDSLGEAKTLSVLGQINDTIGQLPRAFDNYRQALPIFRKLKDHLRLGRTLIDIGYIHYKRGENQEALGRYQQARRSFVEALRIRRTVEAEELLAVTHNNIGSAYEAQGKPETARDHLTKALLMSERLNYTLGQANAHANLGSTYYSIGLQEKALEHLNKALLLFQHLKYDAGEAKTFNAIGAVYDSLSDPDNSLYFYKRALAIYPKLGESIAQAQTLHNSGHAYELKGNLVKAHECYEEALRIFRYLGNRRGQAISLNNIGLIYYWRKEQRRAIEHYEQALSIERELKDRSLAALVLNNLAQAASALPEEKHKVLGYYEEARSIFKSLGDRPKHAVTLGNMGTFYEELGDEQKALDAFKQGIEQLELSRAVTTVEEIKAGIAEPSAFVAKASLLLMKMGREREAFDLIELGRARTFLDRLGNVRPNNLKSRDNRLIREEKELSSKLVSLEHKVRLERSRQEPSPVDISTAEAQYVAAQRQYELLLTRLKLSNPEYASLRNVNTLKLSEVQKLLTKDLTLVSYFMMREKTLAFVIARDSFKAVEIPVREDNIIREIEWFRRFASPTDADSESSKKLHNWLLAPLQQHIKTRNVGIIPHRRLHYVPFAALTDGQRYFGDDYTLFYLPSASALCFVREKSKPAGTQMLALSQGEAEGLPFLRYADDEAEAVAHLYHTDALTTEEASQTGFVRRAGEASIIHIAAHSELNTRSPLFYRIRLGHKLDDEGMLEVREVYNLTLSKASLVVLSACRTQLGNLSQGDDMVALNRAFIYAGTPTVIASLWTVADKSTSELMTSFYTHLKDGMNKGEALRAAQTETRRKYPHPYHWAAFVLTGDPGLPPATTTCRDRQTGKGKGVSHSRRKQPRSALERR